MILLRPLLVPAIAVGLVSTAVPAATASLTGYGFRTGVASSSIHGDSDDFFGSGSRIGFAGGVFGRFSLGRLFSIQPEVGWASKGEQNDLWITYTTMTGPPTSETIDFPVETRLDYLEIPLLLRLDIPTGTFFGPYVLAGPGVAFRTGSAREGGVTFASPAANARIQRANIFEGVGTFDNPRFRNVDWSAIAGGGVALGSGPLRFVLDSRYALGLAGVYPDVDRSWAHNGSWITTLGIEWR